MPDLPSERGLHLHNHDHYSGEALASAEGRPIDSRHLLSPRSHAAPHPYPLPLPSAMEISQIKHIVNTDSPMAIDAFRKKRL